MQKSIINVIGAMALVVALTTSCNKEDAPVLYKEIAVSIEGELGELQQSGDTKSELHNPIRLQWNETDKVYAFDSQRCLGVLDVTLEKGRNDYALLSCESMLTPQGTTITLVHSPGLCMEKGQSITDGQLSLDMAKQMGELSKAPFVACATLQYKQGQSSLKNVKVQFSFATSIIRINCSGLKKNTKISGAMVYGMSNNCVLKINDDGYSIEAGNLEKITLESDNLISGDRGTRSLYAALAKTSTITSAIIEVVQDGKSHEGVLGQVKWKEAVAYNTISPLKPLLPFTVGINSDGTKRTVRFAPGNLYCIRTGSDGNWKYSFAFEANQYDYRTINMSNPSIKNKCVINGEERETTDLNTSGLFQWVSKKYSNPNLDPKIVQEALKNYGAFSVLDKYTTSLDDTVDFGEALGETSIWRTLSGNEMEYLINVRKVGDKSGQGNTCEIVQISTGVADTKVTGLVIFPDNYSGEKDGAKITAIPPGCAFLPASGSRLNSYCTEVGASFSYWCSTSGSTNQSHRLYHEKAKNLILGNGVLNRNYGCSVRLVSEYEMGN